MRKSRVLVTGATGYVGGRLVPRLAEDGYTVVAGGRSLAKLRGRSWANDDGIELMQFDALNAESLYRACQGCEVVYYLVHSMEPGNKHFAETDRIAAENLARVAAETGVKRIIYLGGLGDNDKDLSEHLRSRSEVGRILSAGAVPVTILRAGMIIGSGSASFEILRYLVERLPVMITPKWVATLSQPISIRNVLDYLIGSLGNEGTSGRTFDIGGPHVLTYRALMELYAEESGLGKRLIIPVPVFTPRLSSYWIHFVTPVPASLARPLAEGLRNPVVCKEDSITELIPQRLLDCREAIRLSIEKTEQQMIETRWTDAGAMPVESVIPGDPDWAGGTAYTDHREVVVNDSAEQIWQRINRLGGNVGWSYGNWLWRLRGAMDRLLGGVGLVRGRRDPNFLRVGDVLDFWRIVDVEPMKRVLLFAEMKLPGKAWLEFRITETGEGLRKVEQVARFVPRGLFGLLYWFAVSPLHDYIFNGMLLSLAGKDQRKRKKVLG